MIETELLKAWVFFEVFDGSYNTREAKLLFSLYNDTTYIYIISKRIRATENFLCVDVFIYLEVMLIKNEIYFHMNYILQQYFKKRVKIWRKVRVYVPNMQTNVYWILLHNCKKRQRHRITMCHHFKLMKEFRLWYQNVNFSQNSEN